MRYFTLDELTKSETAIKKNISNMPTNEHKRNLELLVDNVLDPLREATGSPIIVTSGYRSTDLNTAIGGAKKSQHGKGQAADIVAKNPADNSKLFSYIKANLPFDQLIWEKGNDTNPAWVHVSFNSSNNRKEVLKTKNGINYTRIS